MTKAELIEQLKDVKDTDVVEVRAELFKWNIMKVVQKDNKFIIILK